MLYSFPFSKVKINDGFWSFKQDINRKITIPESYQQNLKTGRINAFKLDWKSGRPNKPHRFWDSDVAKWIETASYSLHTHPDPDLKKTLDEVVDLVCSAQQPDGYLNVYYTIVEPELRWKNLKDNHELYCAGHLIEAAVAYFQATGNKKLIDTMCNYVDYIDSIFGEKEGQLRGYPGHEEIELALIKLYHITNNKKHLDLCKFFVDERGNWPHYFMMEEIKRGIPVDPNPFNAVKRYEYNQSHLPVREQSEIVGHAVRAGYLYTGMADLAIETEDKELYEACERIWEDAMLKKMYITGGIGSSRHNEGITTQYDLPNEDAYCETCAAIAMLFWNQRLLHYSLDSKYSNIIEKIMYNGSISGVSLDGRLFFYENPLAISSRRKGFKRQEWFGCACCPNNLSRLIASIGSYIYSRNVDNTEIIIHQFVPSSIDFDVRDHKIVLTQENNYPWDGDLKFKIRADTSIHFMIKIRIPDWCKSFKISVNDEKIDTKIFQGYINLDRIWANEDEINIKLEMEITRMQAHPNVVANTGRVALQRGPMIYCLEEHDNGENLDYICLPQNSKLSEQFKPDLLDGIVAITGKARKLIGNNWDSKLYAEKLDDYEDIEIIAVPYYAWGNRSIGEMAVWIREIL